MVTIVPLEYHTWSSKLVGLLIAFKVLYKQEWPESNEDDSSMVREEATRQCMRNKQKL
jgi:hypothetical protein